MRRLGDVLTGMLIIGSAVITMGIVAIGAYFILRSINFISLFLISGLGFFILHVLRSLYIGLSIIISGRYEDEMTARENRYH